MTKPASKITIGVNVFDPSTGELTISAGRVMLRPQTSSVLEILAQNAGALVPKDYLMEEVWRDTHVTDDSLVQCISEIRKALTAEGGAKVVTIPKKGYRLDVPSAMPAETSVVSEPYARQSPFFLRALVVLAVAAVTGMGFWFARPQQPEQPITIAVLPFLNMSGDASQTYLSNGVAEDLIISLSNISDLRVLSRGTSFSIDQDGSDIREIATTLHADYVLEGSVRRIGDMLRVSASLVDGDTGANVWASRYEGAPDDIFDFQDKVLNALVRNLSVRLSGAERERLGIRGTESVEAYDAYLRGRELENLYTRETNYAAEEALLEAIQLDPRFAFAHAHLALVYSFRVENNWTNDPERYIQQAFASAELAVEIGCGFNGSTQHFNL